MSSQREFLDASARLIEALRSVHLVGGGGVEHEHATSFVEAVYRRAHVLESGKYDLAGNVAIGVAIGFGAWVVAFFVELLVWHAMTFNWRRLLCCGWGKSHKQPWFKPYNSTTEAERRPYVLPVRADTPGATPHPLSVQDHNQLTTDHATVTARIQLPPPRMTSDPRQNLVRRVPILGGGGGGAHVAVDLVQAVPKDQLQHYTVEPSQSTSPHNFYTGHERSRYESYARMTALIVRVVIVISGIIAAFSSAGVNVISVVTGLGIVGILYTYGAQPLVTNVCSSIYIHGSGRIDMLDYITIGTFKGFVGSFNAQFIELIDDLSPFTGGPRRIQQIPTGSFSNTPFSVFPNGPPPVVIDEYFKELDKANALRKQQGIAGMIEPIREIQLWMDPRYVRQEMLMV
jgi:small-conductance mechanosensitive channel